MGHPIGGASASGVPTRCHAPVPTSTGAQYLHANAKVHPCVLAPSAACQGPPYVYIMFCMYPCPNAQCPFVYVIVVFLLPCMAVDV